MASPLNNQAQLIAKNPCGKCRAAGLMACKCKKSSSDDEKDEKQKTTETELLNATYTQTQNLNPGAPPVINLLIREHAAPEQTANPENNTTYSLPITLKPGVNIIEAEEALEELIQDLNRTSVEDPQLNCSDNGNMLQISAPKPQYLAKILEHLAAKEFLALSPELSTQLENVTTNHTEREQTANQASSQNTKGPFSTPTPFNMDCSPLK